MGKTCRISSAGQLHESILDFPTLRDLLSTPDLANLLLKKLVALLANVDNLLAGNAEILDGSKNFFRDLGRRLVLSQGVGVVEGVV